jgi:ribosomal protein L19
MKHIKTNTKTNNATIKEAFKVGDTVKWGTNSFDGRVSEWITFTGTVVKVNRRTVDVERDNGNVYRLEAFVHIRTGEWTLA